MSYQLCFCPRTIHTVVFFLSKHSYTLASHCMQRCEPLLCSICMCMLLTHTYIWQIFPTHFPHTAHTTAALSQKRRAPLHVVRSVVSVRAYMYAKIWRRVAKKKGKKNTLDSVRRMSIKELRLRNVVIAWKLNTDEKGRTKKKNNTTSARATNFHDFPCHKHVHHPATLIC